MHRWCFTGAATVILLASAQQLQQLRAKLAERKAELAKRRQKTGLWARMGIPGTEDRSRNSKPRSGNRTGARVARHEALCVVDRREDV
jgi:hypothetical protein